MYIYTRLYLNYLLCGQILQINSYFGDNFFIIFVLHKKIREGLLQLNILLVHIKNKISQMGTLQYMILLKYFNICIFHIYSVGISNNFIYSHQFWSDILFLLTNRQAKWHFICQFMNSQRNLFDCTLIISLMFLSINCFMDLVNDGESDDQIENTKFHS